MKRMRILGAGVMLAVMFTMAVPVSAASPKDVVGDWRLERLGEPAAGGQRGGMMSSILSLSQDKDGKLVGRIIGMWGITDLDNVKFENDKLSYSQTMRMRDNEFVSQFSGTLRDGKLSGMVSSQRGDVEMVGTRIPTPPAIVGNWEITTTRGEQQMITVLSVSADKDGKLSATWTPQRGQRQGQPREGTAQGGRPAREGQADRPAQGAQGERPQGLRGPGELSDVEYKNGVLTFSRRMMGRGQQQDQQQERITRYVLTAKGDVLSGTVTTPQGERAIEGKRAAASPLAGTWMLTISGERGERTQRLVVYPDMSGLYGATELDKITVEDNAVSFSMSMGFGDRTFENTFKGKLDGEKLVGRMISTGFDGQPMTQDVTGKKL